MSEKTVEIPVRGICCGNSIVRAQKLIKAMPGVASVRIDLARNVAVVHGGFDAAAVTAAIMAAGFGVMAEG